MAPEAVAYMNTNQIGKLEAGILSAIAPARSTDVDFFPGVSLNRRRADDAALWPI
jgi:hypothetical protein